MANLPGLPSIEEKVDFLSRASTYPDCREEVTVVETHMSWVFIAGERVYKLKKPMIRDLIDFSTPDARYLNCREEVRLNRRLGGDTYLGLEQLSVAAEGELKLGRNGVAVDWLVVMKRLPESAMLESQIKAGRVDYDALERAAEFLSAFYVRTDAVMLTAGQYGERLASNIRSNRESLAAYRLPEGQLDLIAGRQLDLVDRRPALFGERARAGRVVEAHGDLRPEHVCLTDPPVIIDCLEFSRDLRIQDRLDELAFLAMECERLGNDRVGEIVLATYADFTGDKPPLSLVAFYKSYRACVRAKLCVWHLDDDPEEQRGPWQKKAETYLAMAERYTEMF
jgi:aminoglycoside phosphotransferase family enzyme